MGKFIYDPDAAGTRYIGKILRAEEMTAQDFDSIRGATLSDKIGPDAPIFYLEAEDLDTGNGRAYFFTPDTRPVSRWKRFLKSLDSIGVRIKCGEDLVGRVFIIEEREIPMGKYGARMTPIIVGIPSPEEIGGVEEGVIEEVKPDIEATILSVADGLTSREFEEELKSLGVDLESARKARTKLIQEGKLTFKSGKYKVL